MNTILEARFLGMFSAPEEKNIMTLLFTEIPWFITYMSVHCTVTTESFKKFETQLSF
jgi:hypothetical protein